ncbi:hypothetical protein IAT38_001074 [Cryptococcus sp. DSM 104549]
MSSMIERLRGRRSSAGQSQPADSAPAAQPSPVYAHRSEPRPYDIPDPKGTSWLLQMPDEVLERIFSYVDRVTFTRCYRVCEQIRTFLSTNSSMELQNLLQSSSLTLNPNAIVPSTLNPHLVPPSKAELLATLRERITRFKNFRPKNITEVNFQESEGRLYEYLEGVLLRSLPVFTMMGRDIGREVAVYELGKLGEWEDDHGTEGRGGREASMGVDDQVSNMDENEDEHSYLRRTKKFDFQMMDFVVDPGQDLFVVGESRVENRNTTIIFHLLTLSTFERHPRAANPELVWPGPVTSLTTRNSQLGFQISDDGLFVLRNNIRGGGRDKLCGWQWTTGRLAVTLTAEPRETFESFINLTPSSFAVPSVRTTIRDESETAGDITDPRDLEFTHHLKLYAFPPFSSVTKPSDGSPAPPHTATHVVTIDMPEFAIDFDQNLPPPRMTIRADPPPRYTFPVHPAGSTQQFVPDPESGVIILEFYCQPMPEPPRTVHYVMFMRKKTLLSYLPAPTSPMLTMGRPMPMPVVTFERIAPKVRMLGPDEPVPSWVCYVYQDRYVSQIPPPNPRAFSPGIRLFDFDPLRIRQEINDRAQVGWKKSDPPGSPLAALLFPKPPRPQSESGSAGEYAGVKDGVHLVVGESTLEKKLPLARAVVTGSELPYMVVDRYFDVEVDAVVIDGERVVAFSEEEDDEGVSVMQVLEF